MAYRTVSESGIDENVNISLSRGQVFGHGVVTLFGENPAVDGALETIWPVGGLYSYIPTAQTVDVSSSSTADTAAGTGLRTARVFGLDGNYLPVQEDVTLSGQTPVETTNAFIRVFRITGLSAGSGLTNAGNIYVSFGATITAGVPNGNIVSYMDTGDGQSNQLTYTVPAGYTGYICYQEYSAQKVSQALDVKVYTRLVNGGDDVFRVRRAYGLLGGTITENLPFWLQLPAKTDIEVRAIAAVGTLPVHGEMQILLVNDIDANPAINFEV